MRALIGCIVAGSLALAALPSGSAPVHTGLASNSPSTPARRRPPADSLYALVFTRGPAWDGERSPGQQSGMREHSANLNRLRSEGRIVLGGRFGDYGLIVLTVRNRAEALALLAPDSATARGVFRAELSPWYTIYEGSVPPR